MPKTMPLPTHYDPAHAAQWSYGPNQMALFASAPVWGKVHGISPAGSDKTKLLLLLIDAQKDFGLPPIFDQAGNHVGGGTLYVGGRSGDGAIEDSRRIVEFIYRNAGAITDVTVTMDTHFPYQIFFTSFWLDADGNHPAPFREVVTEDIRSGKLRPNPTMAWWLCEGNYTWLVKQVLSYTAELERAGKYRLYLWPPHCLLGGDGHALVGIIQEARLFHSLLRGSRNAVEIKGGNPLTENYSVLRPEVLMRWDGEPLDQKNTAFIGKLLTSDAVVIAGQAASHCVKSTIDDLLTEIVAADPKLAKKVYVMTDCMSSVTVPDGKGGFLADFTPAAEDAFKRFADAGMNLVTSTQPVESWPGLKVA
ncbi:MAG: nicotinamidase [bacterium]|nr:nicotinamidase [bacterium]